MVIKNRCILIPANEDVKNTVGRKKIANFAIVSISTFQS